MKICEHEDSCMLIGIACDTCWRKQTVEVDCRKCKNCTGESCLIYGDDADKAVAACARDRFANYELMEEEKNDSIL